MRSEIRTVKTRAEFLDEGDIIQVAHPTMRGRKIWLKVDGIRNRAEGGYRVFAAGTTYAFGVYDIVTCQVVK